MRRRLERAVLMAVAAVLLCWMSPAAASDHRDAPTIGNYSAIDINDLYMFRDPANCTGGPGCTLVIALSTQAVADPQFGSSYHFQENALYRLNFTTRPDAKPTASIDFTFGPFGTSPDCPNPATPCQMFQAAFPGKTVIQGLVTGGTSGATHLPPVITTAGEIKVFAGPREDPFFFDLVGFNRSVATGNPSQFTGVDAFRGKNVNAIVVEFPVDTVFPAGTCGLTPPFSTPCGAWAVAYLGKLKEHHDDDKFDPHPEGLRQVDRMGNPLVNTALIPNALKDSFNFGQPKDDSTDFAPVILDEILALDKKFGTCPPSATNAADCNPNVPLLASILVPDILRFASNANDGYPNGRRPQDRTSDLLISLILNVPGFTDGTTTKTPCLGFPFLRPPLQLGTALPFDSNPQTCP